MNEPVKVVRASSIRELEEVSNVLYDDGYKLNGPVVPILDSYKGLVFYATFIKCGEGLEL